MPTSKSEQYEVKRLGAVPTRNSGRGHHSKGDGILYINGDPFLTTDVKEYSKSYSISESNWAKVTTDARVNNSYPCLQIVLGSEEPRTRIVAVSEKVFLMLLENYMEGQEDG